MAMGLAGPIDLLLRHVTGAWNSSTYRVMRKNSRPWAAAAAAAAYQILRRRWPLRSLRRRVAGGLSFLSGGGDLSLLSGGADAACSYNLTTT